MLRQGAARAQRSGGGPIARETSVPLPLKGLFVDAKSADVSGLYAARLENFRTDGVSLELRAAMVLGVADQVAAQRIPYEFGANPRYILLRSFQAECAGATFTRYFNGRAMAAYISSQAIIADGEDLPLAYNGSTFNACLFTTSTGVNPTAFDGVIAHQDRLFFWETGGRLEFYYGDVGAVTGPLTRFPLDRLGNITGSIVAMASFTVDAGANANDALVIFTSTGDIVVYEGLDPGDANDWNISIRIRCAPPLDRLGIARIAGDIWFLTSVGIVSLSETLRQGALALVNVFARPIADEIRESVLKGGEWQIHAFADGSQIAVNRYTPDVKQQWVWQTDSRAWSTSDYPVRQWHNLALATEGTTGQGRLGSIDPDPEGSEEITAVWHTGWFSLGSEATITWVKPKIVARGALTVKIAVLTDNNESEIDIAEAEQTVIIEPDDPPDPGKTVSLFDVIPVGATGTSFQLRLEITATWAQIVSLQAGIL